MKSTLHSIDISTIERLPLKVSVLVLSVSLICINSIFDIQRLTSCAVLLISIMGFWIYRNSIVYCVIYGFILYSNYSICIANYLVPFRNDFFTSWSGNKSSLVGINILLLTNAILFAIGQRKDIAQESTKMSFLREECYNPVIVVGAVTLSTVIMLLGNKQTAGQRGVTSPIYEYAVIIILIGFYYCGNQKAEKIILTGISGIYCVTDLFSGNRATAVQILIVLFIVMVSGKDKFSFIRILPVAAIGVVGLTAVGQMRQNLSFSISGMLELGKGILKSYFVFDTSYAAYFTSLTFVATTELVSWSERLLLFGRFILSLILGGSKVANLSLPQYTQQYFTHYNGGVFPFYGFFYMGYLGVCLFAIYISTMLQKIRWKTSGFSRCVLVYLAATCTRWYLYTPSACIRGVLLLSLVYGVCYCFDRARNNRLFLQKNELGYRRII